MDRIDSTEVKTQAAGREPEILRALAPQLCEALDAGGRRHVHCPLPGHDDKNPSFRIKTEGGFRAFCTCKEKGYDLFDLLERLRGWKFREAANEVGNYLGINGNGKPQPVDILQAVCQQKRMPIDSAESFGAQLVGRTVVIPAYGSTGKQCTTYRIWLEKGKATKGKNEGGKPAGVFVPRVDGKPRFPASGETVIVAHSVKDAIALHGLDYYAIGLPGCELSHKFARLFQGANVVMIPDRNRTEYERCERNCKRLFESAAKVQRVDLPLAMDGDEGDDVRDLLAKRNGEKLLRQAIADARQVDGDGKPVERVEYESICFSDLPERAREPVYLVEGVLVEGQPCVVAGPHKGMKTNTMIDLCVSISMAGKWLGYFDVPEARRVGFMSGESGDATICETAQRIAKAAGRDIRDLQGVVLSTRLPMFGSAAHMDGLERWIDDNELGGGVLIIDPAYLAMPDVAESANNLFAVGERLRAINELAQDHGCTLIICHHMKKNVGYREPELSDIAWSGWCEYARQWILLNRREPFDPDRNGEHKLFLSVGGSAGHSGAWGLDIVEGRRTDPGGRIWDATILPMTDIRASRKSDKQTEQDRHKEAKFDADCELAIRKLKAEPDGLTQTRLRNQCKVSSERIGRVIEQLLEEKRIESCKLQVSNHKRLTPGYRLPRMTNVAYCEPPGPPGQTTGTSRPADR